MNSWCVIGYQFLKINDFEKNIKAKNSLPSSPANYASEKFSQPGPSASQLNKKDVWLCKGSNSCQQNRILATGVNTITVKKEKNIEKDISHVECFSYHQKYYYANKYLDKQLKTSVSLNDFYVDN